MINLNHLPTFLAVLGQGSISRAAEHLRLSQSAVSAQIGELEQALGHRLFDRVPRRGVEPTSAGEAFGERARAALALIEQGQRAVHDLGDLASGELVIGASSTTGTYLLPAACGRFIRRYPGLALSLVIANSAAVVERLRQDELDLAVTEDDSEHIDCQRRCWLRDEIVLIAAADHPVARSGVLDPATFGEQAWVHREPGSGTRRTVEAQLAARGHVLPAGPTMGSIEALKRAVAAGVGLAWISELAVRDERARGELLAVEVADLHIHRRHDLVIRRGRRPTPSAEAFISLLMELPGAIAAPARDR